MALLYCPNDATEHVGLSRTTLNTINELIDRTKKFGSMAFCKIDRENETSALYFHECIPLKADRQQVTLSFLSDHFVFTSD